MTAPALARPDNWTDVEAARDGDRQAFGVLYDQYVETVFRFVYFRTGNRQLAEDLTSDTFLRALKRVDTFKWQGRDIGAWLVTIARNLIADHFKCAHTRLSVLSGGALCEDGELAAFDTIDPTDVAECVVARVTEPHAAALLWQAVDRLEPSQSKCIRLRYADGLTVAETAAAMGKNEGAIKALAYRACRALRRDLALAGLVESVA